MSVEDTQVFINVLKLRYQHIKHRRVNRRRSPACQAATGPFLAPTMEQALWAPITPVGSPTHKGSGTLESELQTPSLFHLHSSKSRRQTLLYIAL